MSRAMIICMFATTLGVSVPCPAHAPRVMAQTLYDRLDQANANYDLNQVLGFYDSSYLYTNAQGKRLAFAEFRRQLEQNFPLVRHMNPTTTVEDVQFERDRMVVYFKTESHFEFHHQRYGWVPEIYRARGEETWERQGGQWKLVRSTNNRADTQLDPEWVKQQRALINCTGGCPPR